MKIAVDGPDGSGKSTLCDALSVNLDPAIVYYAGKNHNHNYIATSYALKLWKKSQKINTLLGMVFQYFIFYPFEYIENLKRFSIRSNKNIIYDRHPLDRVIMKHELYLKYKKGDASMIRLLIEYLPRKFWSSIYIIFFPKDVKVYLLLPTASLVYERSGGQYKSYSDSEIKILAYKLAMDEWNRASGEVFPIYINENNTIDSITRLILDDIKNNQ